MDKEDKRLEKNSFELLLTLHEQLATNKNAQQGLFIKIFLALFGLFAAYGIVWSQAQGSPRLLNNCNFSFIVNDKILLFCIFCFCCNTWRVILRMLTIVSE